MDIERKYPLLFSPYKVGNRTLRNRIVAGPRSIINIRHNGELTDDQVQFWERPAEGGAAVVTMGESPISSTAGSKDNGLCIYDPQTLPFLAKVSKVIKRHGALANIQLAHAGYYAGMPSAAGERNVHCEKPYGPSDGYVEEMIGENGKTRINRHEYSEMPEEMIWKIVDDFGKAAAICKRAGFDMVMIHGAHGWIFNQFYSPYINKRQDDWGGTHEKRARLYVEVLKSIRKYVGPGFPIEVRMNGSECRDIVGKKGLELNDMIELATIIQDHCDVIDVSASVHEDPRMFGRMIPSMLYPHGVNLEFAAAIKKEVKNCAITALGGLNDPQIMEEALESGKCDLVLTGRSFNSDPFFPRKAERGLDIREIRPCLRCNFCSGQTVEDEWSECQVNPVCMHERDEQIRRSIPTTPKKVMIAGGGPAGMEAAIVAAERGHEVILCEKSDELGGAIKYAKHVDFKEDMYRFKEHLEYMVNKSKVEVHLNTSVTSELVAQVNPDILLVAIGATPIVPKLPGINGKNVHMAEEVHGNVDRVGKNVVILGGGLVGSELGLHLARLGGRQVTIVEMRDTLAADANILHQGPLVHELITRGVNIVTNTTGNAITEKGLQCKDKDGKEIFYEGDVIIAAGYASTDPMIEKLRNATIVTRVIGDCERPGKIKEATTAGHWLALDI